MGLAEEVCNGLVRWSPWSYAGMGRCCCSFCNRIIDYTNGGNWNDTVEQQHSDRCLWLKAWKVHHGLDQ